MKVALIAATALCLILLAWIAHDVNRVCGTDTSCRVQMEAP